MDQMMDKANQDEFKASLSCNQDCATKSQFATLYHSKMRPAKLDKPNMVHNFSQNCIQLNEYTFESFSYEVEKVVLAFEYYKLHVKIGHFSLTANVLCESRPNPLKDNQNISGKYGTAYFAKFNDKCICFKSTNYLDESSFHERFPKAVKEWSILKICSVINCSPRVDPYLGFDIIVYTDCVQYAMERGRPIERLTKAYANILKEKLRTMHQLNIIHFDIKPENIVISEELDEPVFIDFGLSEIVKEGCGLKTFCAFRGTPNYCSPEMMSILGKEPAFVDLYYNDACGLETTIYKQSLIFQDEAVDEVAQFQMDDDDQNDFFYFYAFQFHYLQQNQLQASQQLDRYIQAKGSIKLVLSFIKKIVNYLFLSSIFKKLLVLFSSLSEYSEIEDEIRHSKEMYFSKFVLVESNEGTTNELKLQSYESERGTQLLSGNDFKQYLDLLLNESELDLQNIWQYLQIAFQCIRFDISNLSLPDKAAVAIKVNKLILQHRNGQDHQLQIKQYSELDHVRLLIRLILEECLSSQPTTKWAKDSIFDIFQQAIMVDINITPYIQPFMSFVSKNFRSPMDIALALLELMRLSEALRMVLTDHFESVQIVKKELCSQITVVFKQFEVRSKQLIDPQINMIRKIVRQYMSEYFYQNTADYAQLKNNLKLVKHAKIQKYLLYFMTAKQTGKLFNFTNNDVIFLMIGEMRTMLSSLDFFSSIKITVLILQSTNRFGDIKTYSDQIKKIVNCQEVYERINLDFGAIENPTRIKYFCRNLENFANQYTKVSLLINRSHIYLRQFIIENYKGRNLNNNEPRKWFIHIYPTFCEQVESKYQNLDEQKTESFSIATFLCEISWFYYRLSKQTQGLFLGQINKFEVKLQQPLNDISRYKKRPLILFQKCLFLYQLYHSQGKYLECLESLDTIILICTRLKLKRLALEFMKQHSLISNSLDDESCIIRSSMQLFDFCLHRHINFSSFYLQSANFNHTFTLFVVLARNEPSKLRQLLKTFIDFLQQHPVQSYFANLFTIISRFLKEDPSFGYVIHINHFQIDHLSCPLNPYALIFIIFSLKSEDGESQKSLLKAIAINIDLLIWFVKKTILRQYFIIFMKLLQKNSLRQRIGNFRMAKIYLSSKERKQILKQLSTYQLRRRNYKKCIQSKLVKYMLKM